MVIIIFSIAFLCSICCFSQVTDDFSDGDFTSLPAWVGETGKFRVDAKQQLRLADELKTGSAFLATASTLAAGAEWNFYVHLQFNSSANNYALFYLTGSQCDFSGEGFCVRIGGATDAISLMRYNGDELREVIRGTDKRIDASSPAAWVRVCCDEAGNWMLYTKVKGVDADFLLEGEAKTAPTPASSFVGLRCIYTASRNTSFAFDDIVVREWKGIHPPEEPDIPDEPDVPGGDPNDHVPPRVLSVSAATEKTVNVLFDEAIRLSGLACILDGAGKPRSQNLQNEGRELVLAFADPFVDMRRYTLTLQGVHDVSGNRMEDVQLQFTYYDPSLHASAFGDVVFNEVMANPVTAAGLPEVEYVELYNKQAFPVSLKEWTLHYGNRAVKLPGGVIPAGGYAVLCHEKHVALWEKLKVAPIGVPSFPTLANSGKMLWLTDARDNLIAWVEYSDKWYTDDFKRKGGFSLECVDADNLANDSLNWRASENPSGGTPGAVNSIQGACPDETVSRLHYAYFHSPDTLVLRFDKPMSAASLACEDNYTVLAGDVSLDNRIPVMPDAREVWLALTDSLQVGMELEVELQHLEDISGYPLEGQTVVRLGLPEEPDAGDVLFNELLFNPLPEGYDYVELYNTSPKYINLNRLLLAGRDAEGKLSEGVLLSELPRGIEPGGYLCFSRQPHLLTEQYAAVADRLIQVGRLPSMPDDCGNVLLLNRSGAVLDSVAYSEKMHAAFLRSKEGVALEKVNPLLASADAAHWTSASEASGGGTPGGQNSQYRTWNTEQEAAFQLENRTFTPDGDGADDELLLTYRMDELGVMAMIRIYDSVGRLVHVLAENELLGAEGVFTWDGRKADGTLASAGIYVVYIETYAPSGKQKRHKLACVRSA